MNAKEVVWWLCLGGLGIVNAAETVTMGAFDFSRDKVWENRDGALGIVGNHKVTSGKCTKAFPGKSGKYSIDFNIVTERDGSPKYRISVDGKSIKSGSYPYACGILQCKASKSDCPDRSQTLSIGEVNIEKGDRIEVWGESTYPCGADHGAYCRWKSLKFTLVQAAVGIDPEEETERALISRDGDLYRLTLPEAYRAQPIRFHSASGAFLGIWMPGPQVELAIDTRDLPSGRYFLYSGGPAVQGTSILVE